MQTIELNSKLVENNREYQIFTTHDLGSGTIRSSVRNEGRETELLQQPHPDGIALGEVRSLVEMIHSEQKNEMELLLQAASSAFTSGDAATCCRLGAAFLFKKFAREAIELFQVTLQIDPEYHKALKLLTSAHLAAGDVAGAVEAGEAAVAQKSHFPDYRNCYGEALLADEQCREAYVQFEEALKLNMYYGDAYFNSALALIGDAMSENPSGQQPNFITQACSAIDRASLICQDFDKLSLDRGLQALKQGNMPVAARLFYSLREIRKETQRQESASYFMRFVLSPEASGEEVLYQRIQHLQAKIEKQPTWVDLRVELAECHLKRARLNVSEAIELYKKSLSMNKDLAKANDMLDAAEAEYSRMSELISMIPEKG